MSLAIVGSEDLDTLESYLGDLGFGDIENKNVERKVWTEHAYGPEECGKMVEVVPIKDVRTLNVMFPFPDLKLEHRNQPAHYISHLLGHEGPGSLLSELKRRGWVTSLSAGYYTMGAGYGKFSVTVDLSPDGVEKVDEIIALIFNTIGLVKRTGAQKWVQDELAELGEVKFRFKDKESPMAYATSLAADLQRIPMEHILSSHYLMDQFKPELVSELLEIMRPENMICRVVAKKFKDQEGNTKEAVYGTEMRVSQIPEEKMDRFRAALDEQNPVLALSGPNDYIPTNFDLVERDTKDASTPRLIRDDNWLRVWFKQDNEFKLPKQITRIAITSPACVGDPRSTVLAAMFVMCLQDALTEETYNPLLAGLSHTIDVGFHGIDIRVRGYNEKQNLFVRDLVRRFVNFKPDALRFEVLKEQLRRSLKNFSHGQPYSLSQHYHLLMTAEKYWSKEQMLACSQDLCVKDIEDFLQSTLRALHVEMFVHGNSTEQETMKIADTVLSELRKLPVRPLFSNECDLKREHQLPLGADHVYRHFQPTHSVSCVDITLQCGVQETRENALLELLVQCIQEHAFNVLRTNEQLGYIVHTGARRFCGSQSLELLVQGPKTPDLVEQRIEAYLEVARQSIVDLSDVEFNNYREALASKRLEKPKTLNQRFGRYWMEIDHRQYHFTRDEDEVAVLRQITKEDLLGFFDKCIRRNAPERRKLTVMVHGSGDTRESVEASLKESNTNGEIKHEEISNIDAFRSALPLYAHAAPKLHIPPPGAHITTEEFDTMPDPMPNAKY